MANEVKSMVEEIVEAYNSGAQIEVDVFADAFRADGKKIDHIDILNSLKALEKEGKGVLYLGRRKKKTRFIKGASRPNPANLVGEDKVKSLYEFMMTQGVNAEIKVDDILEMFTTRTEAINALKYMESQNVGIFLIGRRGADSRFIIGTTREAFQQKARGIIMPSVDPLPAPQNGPFAANPIFPPIRANVPVEDKYNFANNIIFKVPNGHSLDELVEIWGLNIDLDKVKTDLASSGFYVVSQLSDKKSDSQSVEIANITEDEADKNINS